MLGLPCLAAHPGKTSKKQKRQSLNLLCSDEMHSNSEVLATAKASRKCSYLLVLQMKLITYSLISQVSD